jgi:hypothetical protein
VVARKRLAGDSSGPSGSGLSPELENYLAETAPPPSSQQHQHNDSNEETPFTKYIFEDEQEDEGGNRLFGFRQPKTVLGIKTDTMVRMLKVCSAFPFVIVVAALNFSNKYAFLR